MPWFSGYGMMPPALGLLVVPIAEMRFTKLLRWSKDEVSPVINLGKIIGRDNGIDGVAVAFLAEMVYVLIIRNDSA